ncbi:MAG: hypothetical protein IT546_07540 [Caulobacteraceae bacterium]|nr:hypothetical protein [Caulobacteraceae bacterium]
MKTISDEAIARAFWAASWVARYGTREEQSGRFKARQTTVAPPMPDWYRKRCGLPDR